MKLNIKVGDRFNKWTIVEERTEISSRRKFLCKCDCGNTGVVYLCQLRASKRGSKSCGCIRFKHGMIGSLTHRSWMSMKQRCMNKMHNAYSRYGGRGITVCERWIDSFMDFLNDMGPRPEGKTLDRIDNDGNYEPGNCKWSTGSEQSRNTRKTRFFEGKKVTDIGQEIGMPHTWLYGKLGKYSMESIELIKEYGPHAVVKKDISGNIISIYKDAKTAYEETGILPSSISKCCRKEINAITAGGFYWDFLLPEKIVEDTRQMSTFMKNKLKSPKKETYLKETEDYCIGETYYLEGDLPYFISGCKKSEENICID